MDDVIFLISRDIGTGLWRVHICLSVRACVRTYGVLECVYVIVLCMLCYVYCYKMYGELEQQTDLLVVKIPSAGSPIVLPAIGDTTTV